MAEVIMIEKKKFDELFEDTRKELELNRYKWLDQMPQELRQRVVDMHRTFNYHVCVLKGKLEES